MSLGGNCAVTYHLNRLKLRHEAYPFDWCKIKLPKLIKAFKEDFKEYDKLSIKKFSEAHEDTFLIENLYGNFAHEVSKRDEFDNFRESLLRRIDRIRKVDNPIFVRLETFNFKNEKVYKEYLHELCRILDTKYQNYTMIVISKFNPFHKKIKWISYSSYSSDWKNSEIDWESILKIK